MISVILPVYNCEKYIDGILDALWRQTYQNFEVICVNDGSNDGTLSCLKKQQECHECLKVLSISNSGPSIARNVGLDAACKKYVCFIDADDMISDTYLEDLLESVEKNHSDMAVCQIKRMYEYQPGFLEKTFNYIQNESFSDGSTILEQKEMLIQLLSAPFAKIIRRDFLTSHQLHFVPGKIAEDMLFTKSILLYQAKVSFVQKQNYFYSVRKGSLTTGALEKAYDLAEVFDELVLLAKKQGLYEMFKDELEYLCIYHCCIDMSFRMFKASKRLFASVTPAREMMKKYGFAAKNPYVSTLNWVVRIYLFVFFNF